MERLDNVFEGSPWYGVPLLEIVTQINNPNARIGEGNSIGHLLAHMIQWRIFAIEKLKQNEDYDIEINSVRDWNKEKQYTIAELEDLTEQLKQTQTDLKNLLQDKSEDWLRGIVSGRTYTFSFLVEGIIQHDIYHLGQISLLRNS